MKESLKKAITDLQYEVTHETDKTVSIYCNTMQSPRDLPLLEVEATDSLEDFLAREVHKRRLGAIIDVGLCSRHPATMKFIR